MTRRKGNTKWSFSEVRTEALKYTTRKLFKNGSAGAYDAARRNKWLDVVCSGMKSGRASKWTLDKCRREALRFSTRSKFSFGSRAAYLAAQSRNWLDEICSHMKPAPAQWTFDGCLSEARKYRTIRDFVSGSKRAYEVSRRRGWLTDVTSHMTRLGNLSMRLVYHIVSADKRSVYVGLTYNIKKRLLQHRLSGRREVAELLSGEHIVVCSSLLPVGDAIIKEAADIEAFRKNGCLVLNVARAGALGTAPKWTFERISEAAQQFKTRNAFLLGRKSAYNAAIRQGCLDQVCAHMVRQRRSWGFDECRVEAAKYSSRTEFRSGNQYASKIAAQNGWLDRVCVHMASR